MLVAPVFTEDGQVEYYLPEGTWTHLLTGETQAQAQAPHLTSPHPEISA
ncbi:hypothetical protein ACN6LJ_001783 [Streptomyces drozdowiczii]